MIGYPNKKKISTTHSVSDNYTRRGMSLEKDLNDSNAYYADCDRALIHKKPTPIQVVKVDYPARNSAKSQRHTTKLLVRPITTVSIVDGQ